jgi:hypothetical protein
MRFRSNADSKKTQRMLDAIKDLKREHYVGTAEVFVGIKQRDEFRENPAIIADAINESVKEELAKHGHMGPLMYMARPEIIIGVIDGMHDAVFILNDVLNRFYSSNSTEHSIDVMDLFSAKGYYLFGYGKEGDRTPGEILGFDPTFDTRSVFGGNLMVDSELNPIHSRIFDGPKTQDDANKKIIEVMVPIFIEAQSIDMNDKIFGAFAARRLFGLLPLHDDERNGLLALINDIDWDYLLSEKNMIRVEQEMLKEGFSVYGKIERAFADGIDKRRDMRLEILNDIITECRDFDMDYKNILEVWENKAAQAEDNVARLKRCLAPESIIGKSEHSLKCASYVVQILREERGWGEKQLER